MDPTIDLLALVRAIAADVAAQPDFDACARRLRVGLLRLGFCRAGILEAIPGDSSHLKGTWGTSLDGSETDEHGEVVSLREFVAFDAIASGERIILRRVMVPDNSDTTFRSFEVAAEGPPNHACVALRAEGQFIGIISADMLPSDRSLGQASLAALELLADLVAIVVARGRVASALHRSEAQYRQIVETAQEGVWIVDASGATTFVNQKMSDLLRYAPEELVGTSVLGFVHPEDREVVARYLTGSDEGLDARGDVRLFRRDGSVLWVFVNASPLSDPQGHYAGVLAMVTDITERRAMEEVLRNSERHFRLLIERSTDIFAILNDDGTLRYVSPSMGATLGYTLDESLGDNPLNLLHPDDEPKVTRIMEAIRRESGVPHATQARFRHANGSWRLFEAIGVNLLAEPVIAGIVATLRDITDRHRLEEQLRQAQKIEAIGLLAGGVAHDFNNLLTVINGFGELLVPQLAPGTFQSEAVQQILKAGESAASLTRQLLAFSRRQVVSPKEVDLNLVVDQLGKMLRRLIGEDIAFTTSLATGLGLVMADSGQIEQVLLNLATNARDAMPRGGKLAIETANADVDELGHPAYSDLPAGPYVMFAVSDTGVGMSEEIKARIFDPFFTTKEPGEGTGLGLAAVYGIVKQSGGSIYVDSEVGQGTTIRVYFPRVGRPTEVAVPSDASFVHLHGSETILVVEDASALRNLARLALQRRGYTVLEAENGEAAVRIAEEYDRPIHLLLADVVMPGLGGRQSAEKIVERRPSIKVVYMSGYTDDVVMRHGIVESRGVFLQKPFSPFTLAKLVRTVLDGGAVE